MLSLPRRRWQFGLPQLFLAVTAFAVALAVGRYYGSNAVETTVVLIGTGMYCVLLVLPGVAFASLGVRYGWPVTSATVGGGAIVASYVLLAELQGERYPALAYGGMALLGAVVGLLCGIGIRKRAMVEAQAVGWAVVRGRQGRRGKVLLLAVLVVWLACLQIAAFSCLLETRQFRSDGDAVAIETYVHSLVALPVLVGCGALWAGLGRRLFAVRLAIVAGAIALLFSLRPGDLTLLFGVQALLVVTAIRLGRRMGEKNAASAYASSPLRTALLHDGLPLVVAACLLCISASSIVGSSLAVAATTVLIGVCWGIVTLAAAWAVLGRRRWWLRAAVVALATVWAGDLMAGLTLARGELQPLFEITEYEALGWWWFVIAAVVAATIMFWLGAWRFATRPSPAGSKPASAKARLRMFARLAAGCAAVGIAIALAIPPALLYRQLIDWPTATATALPDPNGLDDLVRAHGAIARQIMIEPQTLDEKRGWVTRHAAELTLARKGLGRECRVPNHKSAYPNRVYRLFNLAGDVAVAEGRTSEALQSYLDAMRTVRAASGGVGLWGITGEGDAATNLVHKLCAIQSQLEGEELHRALSALQALESDVESFAEVAHQAKAGARDWRGRLRVLLDETRSPGNVNWSSRSYANGRTAMRLLIGNVALEIYREEHGRFPASLAELTPGLLPDIPLDPYGPTVNVPLVYRTTGDGFLFYSIGPDWTDDGGKRCFNAGSPGDFDLEYFERLSE